MVDIAANKALARSYFTMLEADDAAGALALLSDDALWTVPGESELAGTMTKADVLAMFEGGLPFAAPLAFVIHDMIAEGDRVVVRVEGRAPLKDGRDYHNFYVFIFTIAAGRITSVIEHTDTLYSFRALIETQQQGGG